VAFGDFGVLTGAAVGGVGAADAVGVLVAFGDFGVLTGAAVGGVGAADAVGAVDAVGALEFLPDLPSAAAGAKG
jgi:hypothetical protein